jgi:hypothetical protein
MLVLARTADGRLLADDNDVDFVIDNPEAVRCRASHRAQRDGDKSPGYEPGPKISSNFFVPGPVSTNDMTGEEVKSPDFGVSYQRS